MPESNEELPLSNKVKAKPVVATANTSTKQGINADTTVVQQGRRAKFNPETGVDKAQRRQMIAEAAYYRYQNRSYITGCDVDDWLAAEEEIDRLLNF